MLGEAVMEVGGHHHKCLRSPIQKQRSRDCNPQLTNNLLRPSVSARARDPPGIEMLSPFEL